MKKILLFVLCVISAQFANADILFRGDFESGTIFPLGNGTDDKTVDSFFYGAMGPNCTPNNREYSTDNDNTLVTSPVRYGKYANVQTIRRKCDYRSYNGDIYQKPRQELGVNQDSVVIANKNEYWIAFSVFIPTSYNYDYGNADMSVFQLKKFDNSTCCFAHVYTEQDQFVFEMPALRDASGKEVSQLSSRSYSWSLTKGVWHDIAVNFRACTQSEKSAGCKPFMNLYVSVDGANKTVPVATWSGNANTNSTKGIDGPKLNAYKYGWNCTKEGPNYTGKYDDARKDFKFCMTNPNKTTNPNTVTIYFDELMVGNSNSSLKEVAPYLFPAVDPVPDMSCTKADTAITNGLAQGWYKYTVTDPKDWNYKITVKNGYCISTNKLASDPVPDMGCAKAQTAIGNGIGGGWYKHDETDPTQWNHKITVKNAYCLSHP